MSSRRAWMMGRVIFGMTWLVVPEAGASPDGRPWGRGVMMPSLGLGVGFAGELTTLGVGLGFGYFVVDGLRLGVAVSDTVFLYHESLRRDLPGLVDQVTNNSVSVHPNLQYVFLRTRRISPYVAAGVGPVFRNHGGGVVGEWSAGPGIYIGVGGPVAIDLGFGFASKFPASGCNDAFYYAGPTAEGVIVDDCSFTYGPRIGLAIGLGGRSARRARDERRSPPPEPTWEPLPSNPPPPPPPAAQPPPAEASPAEPPPAEPPPAEPGDESPAGASANYAGTSPASSV